MDPKNRDKALSAALRAREAAKASIAELTAAISELDEAIEDTPTIRPPSVPSMQAAQVPIRRFPK